MAGPGPFHVGVGGQGSAKMAIGPSASAYPSAKMAIELAGRPHRCVRAAIRCTFARIAQPRRQLGAHFYASLSHGANSVHIFTHRSATAPTRCTFLRIARPPRQLRYAFARIARPRRQLGAHSRASLGHRADSTHIFMHRWATAPIRRGTKGDGAILRHTLVEAVFARSRKKLRNPTIALCWSPLFA